MKYQFPKLFLFLLFTSFIFSQDFSVELLKDIKEEI